MKKKMTLSLAFACILFVTVLALSAYAASNILGGRPDETLSPGENSLPDPTAAPTPIPLDWEEGMVWSAPQDRYYHVEETCGGMTNAQFVTLEEARARGQGACPNCMGPIMSTPAPTLEPDLLPMVTSEPTPIPMALPTPMPMEPMPYWTTPYGNYYHLDEFCSGMEDAMRVSFETAMNMGKQPCPVCVEEYFRGLEMDTALEAEQTASATLPPEPLPDDAPPYGPDSDGLSLMTDFNQPLRTGEPRGWGIDLTDPNMDDFSAGSEPLNSENNGSWTNDILTVHNAIMLRTRSAVFCEFEFSMNDATVSPWSIRITPLVGESLLGWYDARVYEATSADNTTRYLLSIVMDSPADFSNMTNVWYVYGSDAVETQRMLGVLGNYEELAKALAKVAARNR